MHAFHIVSVDFDLVAINIIDYRAVEMRRRQSPE
jgi:hypothetical protein